MNFQNPREVMFKILDGESLPKTEWYLIVAKINKPKDLITKQENTRQFEGRKLQILRSMLDSGQLVFLDCSLRDHEMKNMFINLNADILPYYSHFSYLDTAFMGIVPKNVAVSIKIINSDTGSVIEEFTSTVAANERACNLSPCFEPHRPLKFQSSFYLINQIQYKHEEHGWMKFESSMKEHSEMIMESLKKNKIGEVISIYQSGKMNKRLNELGLFGPNVLQFKAFAKKIEEQKQFSKQIDILMEFIQAGLKIIQPYFYFQSSKLIGRIVERIQRQFLKLPSSKLIIKPLIGALWEYLSLDDCLQ